jgi:hypothetical protein
MRFRGELCAVNGRAQAGDPSPGPPRLKKTPVRSTLSPKGERAGFCGGRGRHSAGGEGGILRRARLGFCVNRGPGLCSLFPIPSLYFTR